MWFNIEYDSSTQDSILVRVPSAFYRDQLAKSYQKAIEAKLFELSGKRLTIEFVVVRPDSSGSVPRTAPAPRQETKPAKPQPEPEKPREKHPQLNLAHTFENYIIRNNFV